MEYLSKRRYDESAAELKHLMGAQNVKSVIPKNVNIFRYLQRLILDHYAPK